MLSTILVVDDHPMFRAGLATLLALEPDILAVVQAGSAREAVDLVEREPIDIALIDVLMPTTSGISLAAQLLERRSSCKVIALSAIDDPPMIAAMLQAGASGYALKTQPASEIADAIRVTRTGSRYLAPEIDRQAVLAMLGKVADQPLQGLTFREREVFEHLIRGRSNDEIASALFISPRTVETHRFRISRKLATRSIIDMMRIAARHEALSA